MAFGKTWKVTGYVSTTNITIVTTFRVKKDELARFIYKKSAYVLDPGNNQWKFSLANGYLLYGSNMTDRE